MKNFRSPFGMRVIGWLIMIVAATAGPAQALAAVAVSEALAGHPVGWWCAGLALATALRALATYGVHGLSARAAAQATKGLHHRFRPGVICTAPHVHGDIATVVGGQLVVTRLRGELAGLWMGAAVTVGWLDLRLLGVWLGAGAVIILIALSGAGLREVVRVRQLSIATDQRQQAVIASAPLLSSLNVIEYAVSREALADAPMHRAQARADALLRRPAARAQIVAGVTQSIIAACAVGASTHGSNIAGAIAVILATTTAAARCELLATVAQQMVNARLAWRRLLRVPHLTPTAMRDPGAATIALGVGKIVRISAGASVALLSSPAQAARVLAALRGAGGMPVMIETHGAVITPAAGLQEWAAQVAIVGAGDRLFAGSIRQNLDPTSAHDDHALHAALAQVGFSTVAERLADQLGPGGSGVSAGETFRLALARAILAQPRVLVLNDPTCALDHVTASVIHQFIRTERRPWTLVVLGPDPATAATCEQVLTLSDREIDDELCPCADAPNARRG